MHPHSAWALFTRLGEAQILLPAMAAALLWLGRRAHTRPLAGAWVAATAAAALLTAATKVAFIGYAVGYAPWNYTGISGHAMFAAAVLPVLARIAAGELPPPWPRIAIALGYALAVAVAYSRVVTHTHSGSDSALGLALGALGSAWALRRTQAPETPAPGWLAAGLAAWLLVLPFGAPASHSHDWVTAVSLQLSGRGAPYTRGEMHRRAATARWLSRDGIHAPPDRQL